MFNNTSKTISRLLTYVLAIIMCFMSNYIISNSWTYNYNREITSLSLRPTALKNSSAGLSFRHPTPHDIREHKKRGKIPGAYTEVAVYAGSVYAKSGSKQYTVPAGTKIIVEDGVLKYLSKEEKGGIREEFRGTPLKEILAQFLASQELSLEQIKRIEAAFGFKDNKAIEINIDMLPDPAKDKNAENIVKGILETIARRMLFYRRDLRFSGKLYIEFVSRKGDTERQKSVEKLFKSMDIVERYGLENMLSENAGDIEGSNKLTITYLNDQSEFYNPALILKTTAMEDEMIMVYPWHVSVDLAVSILSIDRDKPINDQRQVYQAIKLIFTDLLKGEVEDRDLDRLLEQFLSQNREEYVYAARQLALPAVQQIGFDYIEELHKIIMEVARHA
jgi:hypothetical protein